MADAKNDDASKEEPKPKSKKKLIVIIAVVLVVLAAGGGGAFFFLQKKAPDGEHAEGGETETAEAEEEEGEPVAYLPLAPAFVVNFQPGAKGEKPRAKFLSVDIEALPANAEAGEKITMHMPAVRNAVILHLSKQSYETLITPEGKETLRTEVLAEIQNVLKKTIKQDGVKDIFFTSFVMQ